MTEQSCFARKGGRCSVLTVEEMLELEPELRWIADKAARQSASAGDPWPAYSAAKAAAEELVGYLARDERLASVAAHHRYIAYLADRMGI